MSFRRDPIDRRYPERLTASTVASLVLHALFAVLFFAVALTSSQQGATERVSGAETVTFERRSPVVLARAPAAPQAAAPVPHVPRIAPLRHAPVTQPRAQHLPQNLHELARNVPSAPPNPRPIPQRSAQPAPQPTRFVYEPNPANALPAAPLSIPTVAPLAVAVSPPPSARPSPAPTARPTRAPSPQPPAPTRAPSPKPAVAAAVRPTLRPSPLPPAAPATAPPHATPAPPAPHATASPAPRAGVPSPSAQRPATVAKTPGRAPSPGPKGGHHPGPVAGAHRRSAPSPARPIEVPATPRPRRTSRPSGSNLNARLRALLPHNPVHVVDKTFRPNISLAGQMQPTPPPAVLAHTRYIFESAGIGGEARVKMWVTATHKVGLTTICTGWLVRFPRPAMGMGYAPPPPNDHIGPNNGTQIGIGGGSIGAGPAPFAAGTRPIVDGIVSMPCNGRELKPFAASAGSSP